MSSGKKKNNKNKPLSVRIIGGEHRGRKIYVSPKLDLRPSKDNTRETVFNWLFGKIPNAVCLDLFAGTGVFGFECISRGAKKVYFVEKDRDTYESIIKHSDIILSEEQNTIKEIIRADVVSELNNSLSSIQTYPWDLVFLDPPFGLGIGYCGEILQKLHKHKNTTENTIVYVETNSARELNLDGWEIYKTKNFGRITSLLLTKKPL